MLPISGINPRLRIVGIARNQVGNNPHRPLKAPIIEPAISAIKGLLTSTPVGSVEIINRLIAVTTTEIRNAVIIHSPK
jgi:hypothetical protein